MNAQEMLATLQPLYSQLQQYARDTATSQNDDPIRDETVAGFQNEVNALAFDDPEGMGAKVNTGLVAWTSWADAFSNVCKELLRYRELWDYSRSTGLTDEGLKLPGTSGGISLGWSSVSIGDSGASPDDPMTGWFDNSVQQTFARLTTAGVVDTFTSVVSPLKPIGDAIDDAAGELGKWFLIVAAALAVLLVLFIVASR